MSEADIAEGQRLAEQALTATRSAQARLEQAGTDIRALVAETNWQSKAAMAFNDQVQLHAVIATESASAAQHQADAISYAIPTVVGTRGGV